MSGSPSPSGSATQDTLTKIDKGTLQLVNYTAIGITFIFAALSAFMAWKLHIELDNLKMDSATPGFTAIVDNDLLTAEGLPADTSMAVALEHDFQQGRRALLRSLIASRLYLQAVSLLAGMGLIVMGGSLILARVREATQGKLNVNIQDGDTRKAVIDMATSFPGLILAMLGVLTISVALISGASSKIANEDGTLFFGHGFVARGAGQTAVEVPKPNVDENADPNASFLDDYGQGAAAEGDGS